MSEPRIAIISPNRNAWSETFIQAHIERLPNVVLVLTDGHLPTRDADGVPLVSDDVLARSKRRVGGVSREDALRRRIVNMLRRHRAQVVLAEYGPTGAAMLPLCREAGIPLVVHFHGIDAFHTDLLARHDRYRELFAGAALLVAVSREMERQLLDLGAPREKVVYNTYGIDLDRFVPADAGAAPKVFTAIGRFVDKKAPHLTVLAFHRALQQDPGMRLQLIGDGPLREAVVQLVRALGIGHAVELPGVLPPEEVSARLKGSRAFVQHSVVTSANDHEGTPLAVLEAMACGLPVVATRHAGIPDVVEEGVSGLLSAEGDLEAMAQHLLRLSGDPAEAARMGRAGRARVERDHRVQDRIATLHGLLVGATGR